MFYDKLLFYKQPNVHKIEKKIFKFEKFVTKIYSLN